MPARSTHLNWGLTGGIGSGKSTVAHMLVHLGAGLVDADAISRQSTASGGSAIEAIRQHFGPASIDATGAMHRPHIRQVCFSDPAARQALEAIIHPIVREQARQQAQAMIEEGKPLIVWDIPLLIESGHWRQEMDGVLVVDCPTEVQVQRVISRSGTGAAAMNEAQVRAIIAAQASRAQRLACADVVIYNHDMDLTELNRQVGQFYLQLLGQPPQQARETKLSSGL